MLLGCWAVFDVEVRVDVASVDLGRRWVYGVRFWWLMQTGVYLRLAVRHDKKYAQAMTRPTPPSQGKNVLRLSQNY